MRGQKILRRALPAAAMHRSPLAFLLASLSLLAPAACSGAGASTGAAGAPAASRGAPATSDDATAPTGPRSCRARTPARNVELRQASVVAEVAGISYAAAQRSESDEVVLVWLGEDGDLDELPIARLPILHALSGSTVHLLGSAPDRSAWFVETLDLSAPDAPRRIEDRAVAGVPVGVVSGFAADGARLVISELLPRDGEAKPVTFFVDRETGRAAERWDFSVASSSFCDGAGCVLVALDHAARRSVATWEPHGGRPGERLEIGPYPGYLVHRVPVEGGALLLEPEHDGWSGALVAAAAPRLRPLPRALAPTGDCPFDSVVPGRFPGVVLCKENARTLVRWSAAQPSLTAVEPLPPSSGREERYVAHPDGVIRVSWTGGSGLMHGPEYQGMRLYHKHWTFEGGEVSLLERSVEGEGRWSARDAAPLVLHDAEGEFSHGYEPHVLVRGPRAAVLITPDGHGDPAWLQPVREPCP